MSVETLTRVFNQSAAKQGSRLVLLALADRANEHDTAYPGIKDIMRRTNLSERSVYSANADCMALGELIWVPSISKRLTNLYLIATGLTKHQIEESLRIEFSAPKEVAAKISDALLTLQTLQGKDLHTLQSLQDTLQILHPPPANSAPPPCKSCTQTPANSAPKPSYNRHEPSSSADAGNAPANSAKKDPVAHMVERANIPVTKEQIEEIALGGVQPQGKVKKHLTAFKTDVTNAINAKGFQFSSKMENIAKLHLSANGNLPNIKEAISIIADGAWESRTHIGCDELIQQLNIAAAALAAPAINYAPSKFEDDADFDPLKAAKEF